MQHLFCKFSWQCPSTFVPEVVNLHPTFTLKIWSNKSYKHFKEIRFKESKVTNFDNQQPLHWPTIVLTRSSPNKVLACVAQHSTLVAHWFNNCPLQIDRLYQEVSRKTLENTVWHTFFTMSCSGLRIAPDPQYTAEIIVMMTSLGAKPKELTQIFCQTIMRNYNEKSKLQNRCKNHRNSFTIWFLLV